MSKNIILGVGIDVESIDKFEGLKSSFLDKVFTKKELSDCKKKKNFAESLAGRFAAKEAIRKTIKESTPFNKIEIINEKDGSPKVVFLDKKMKKNYESLISISHTKKIAQAICLTLKK